MPLPILFVVAGAVAIGLTLLLKRWPIALGLTGAACVAFGLVWYLQARGLEAAHVDPGGLYAMAATP